MIPAALAFVGFLAAVVFVNGTRSELRELQQEELRHSEIAWELRLGVVQVQQWLTDISATRGLDGLDDGFVEAKNHHDQFISNLKTLQSEIRDEGLLDRLTHVERAFESYYSVGVAMAEAYVQGGPELGNQSMAQFDAAAEGLSDSLTPVLETIFSHAEGHLSEIVSGSGTLVRSLVAGAVLICLGSVLLGWFISRAISLPLVDAIGKLCTGSREIREASGEVSNSSMSLADNCTSQASQLEQSNASYEVISAATLENANRASEANSLMVETHDSIQSASGMLKGLVSSMEEIATRDQETQKIIKTIDEIAFQTNLLALNAAVEAARAGEAGAGFAVVADEVRNLAGRAATAAQNTSEMIERSAGEIEGGVEKARRTREAYATITDRSSRVTELVGDISNACGEQRDQLAESTRHLADLETHVHSNAAVAEESASVSREMENQSQSLDQVIHQLESIVEPKEGGAYSVSPFVASPGKPENSSSNRTVEGAFSFN